MRVVSLSIQGARAARDRLLLLQRHTAAGRAQEPRSGRQFTHLRREERHDLLLHQRLAEELTRRSTTNRCSLTATDSVGRNGASSRIRDRPDWLA